MEIGKIHSIIIPKRPISPNFPNLPNFPKHPNLCLLSPLKFHLLHLVRPDQEYRMTIGYLEGSHHKATLAVEFCA